MRTRTLSPEWTGTRATIETSNKQLVALRISSSNSISSSGDDSDRNGENEMKPARRECQFLTVDVLTSGSEFTGRALFLSLWNAPPFNSTTSSDYLLELINNTTPLARYAISGLGDATSRLCADQRFKLGTTRAVFVPSQNGYIDGLPALLMALRSSGAPSLHVVGCEGTGIIRDIVLGPSSTLELHECKVPRIDPKDKEEPIKPIWWLVYTDDFLKVHASWCDTSLETELFYLFTVEGSSHKITLALVPSSADLYKHAPTCMSSLPILEGSNGNPLAVDVVVTLSRKWNDWDVGEQPIILTAEPSQRFDAGILIRSQQVLTHMRREVPRAFPLEAIEVGGEELTLNCNSLLKRIRMKAGTSVLLDLPSKSARLLDRRQAIWKRPISDEWSITVDSLLDFVAEDPIECTDENEIDIEDDEVSFVQEGSDRLCVELRNLPDWHFPQLQVLGTGCANPAAARGSSGYLLSFPAPNNDEVDLFLVDCGEGMATMLSRCTTWLPNHWSQSVRGIWISHAHLDHFGGLPTVLRAILKARDSRKKRRKKQVEDVSVTKRSRLLDESPCWVIAPAKVFRLVDMILDCKGGLRSDGSRIFLPHLHGSPVPPPGPWNHFESVRVDHSCCESFGLLIGWSSFSSQKTNGYSHQHWFCFSGDTRPVISLPQACHKARGKFSGGSQLQRYDSQPLFLLHEATFEDSENLQAVAKKHSTVSEALTVGEKCRASRILLTHFSQRYISLKIKGSRIGRVGLAMDGLCVPLEERCTT